MLKGATKIGHAKGRANELVEAMIGTDGGFVRISCIQGNLSISKGEVNGRRCKEERICRVR